MTNETDPAVIERTAFEDATPISKKEYKKIRVAAYAEYEKIRNAALVRVK
jgi:hypothetical protein